MAHVLTPGSQFVSNSKFFILSQMLETISITVFYHSNRGLSADGYPYCTYNAIKRHYFGYFGTFYQELFLITLNQR